MTTLFLPLSIVFFWFLFWLFSTVFAIFFVLTPIRYLFSGLTGFLRSARRGNRL